MSTQKHIIEIAPLEYRTEHERITFRNFTCPLCGVGKDDFEPEE